MDPNNMEPLLLPVSLLHIFPYEVQSMSLKSQSVSYDRFEGIFKTISPLVWRYSLKLTKTFDVFC